jgi:hypothetical protein
LLICCVVLNNVPIHNRSDKEDALSSRFGGVDVCCRALQEEYVVILELNSSQLEALRIKVAADQQEANYDVQYVN